MYRIAYDLVEIIQIVTLFSLTYFNEMIIPSPRLIIFLFEIFDFFEIFFFECEIFLEPQGVAYCEAKSPISNDLAERREDLISVGTPLGLYSRFIISDERNSLEFIIKDERNLI